MRHRVRFPILASILMVSPAAAQVVINEVAYDAPGADGGQVFIEVFGPAGTDVSGFTLQSVEGSGAASGTNNPDMFTFPPGTLIPGDGLLVVADDDGTGVTSVANADFIVGDIDLENGADGLQLIDAAGGLADAVAYGPVTTTINTDNGLPYVEGSPARDVFAPLSIERCPAGSDTDDNSVDFVPNEPSPGVAESCCNAIELVSQGFGLGISSSGGESIGIDVFVDCAPIGPYILLGAFTDPSVVPPILPGAPVFDMFTLDLLALANTPPFTNWTFLLDGNGTSVGNSFLDFSVAMPTVAMDVDLFVGAVAFEPPLFTPVITNVVTIGIEP